MANSCYGTRRKKFGIGQIFAFFRHKIILLIVIGLSFFVFGVAGFDADGCSLSADEGLIVGFAQSEAQMSVATAPSSQSVSRNTLSAHKKSRFRIAGFLSAINAKIHSFRFVRFLIESKKSNVSLQNRFLRLVLFKQTVK